MSERKKIKIVRIAHIVGLVLALGFYFVPFASWTTNSAGEPMTLFSMSMFDCLKSPLTFNGIVSLLVLIGIVVSLILSIVSLKFKINCFISYFFNLIIVLYVAPALSYFSDAVESAYFLVSILLVIYFLSLVGLGFTSITSDAQKGKILRLDDQDESK